MKLYEFENFRETFICPYCNASKSAVLFDAPPPHFRGVKCKSCSRYIDWIRADKNILRRKNLGSGTTDEVWSAYDNRCAVCNLTPEQLKALNIARTIQHVPAYKDAGEDANLIPLCQWCQEDATRSMRRMEALVDRLAAIKSILA